MTVGLKSLHGTKGGAGKTFGNNIPKEINKDFYMNNPLTIEQMTNDGIELTQYLLKYLKKSYSCWHILGVNFGNLNGFIATRFNPYLYRP
tara:strand:+ start:867 stop:1136 length:270 start_codon:yes stop_codon:yes gene_type:complete